MAGIARLREVRGDVVGIRGSLIILEVASHAGRAVQGVVVVDVAIDALPRWNRVHAGQRKPGRGVIKCCVSPEHGIVARLTGSRETGVRHRTGRIVVVRLMATDAGGAG